MYITRQNEHVTGKYATISKGPWSYFQLPTNIFQRIQYSVGFAGEVVVFECGFSQLHDFLNSKIFPRPPPDPGSYEPPPGVQASRGSIAMCYVSSWQLWELPENVPSATNKNSGSTNRSFQVVGWFVLGRVGFEAAVFRA